MKNKKYALISVYDKTGILDLAKAFVKANISIIATGGTATHLQKNNIPFIYIEEITKNPESFDGRMKTISFQIASGILFDRAEKKHVQEAKTLQIPYIDFVVCNFYPFWQNPGIEMIDVGGPTMVRAAAKNYQSVTTIIDIADYEKTREALKQQKETRAEFRKELAAKAFSYVAEYDALISNFFQKEVGGSDKSFTFRNGQHLRYGENPHQKGMFYPEKTEDALGLGQFIQVQGKETSFNNYLDLDAGVQTISLIGAEKPACVILKHNNPCGAAIAETISDAFQKAWFEGDPLAAFGGVILMNRTITGTLAKQMLADKKFFEILAAPEFTKEALAVFAQKPKLQLLENKALLHPQTVPYEDIKRLRGGFLVQDADIYPLDKTQLACVTNKKPTKKQIDDLLFAWNICRVSKSNCVVIAKDGVLLASGVGQQDRKRCCELCISKASGSTENTVAATDGFFPFRDGPDVLIKAGIKAIIQPGGSIRDQETIDA
ncbi:MAG TPA: bifunctional phosphoribosylaminoimidazolecarboxamide formyltransferase/IMP cyclohydrolase [Candidatus Saccharimonadales bacterium]|nr:bifunctional phosphoribosylaminoimidazolecarboxamide formyltransferase/IMP cyclohydrolase [Candidatus Saccharimonadales bacterium]